MIHTTWARTSAACLLLLTSSSALAAAGKANQTARLSYSRAHGAERCPDELSLRAQISASLGYDPFWEPALLAIRATLSPKGEQVKAQLEVATIDGKPKDHKEFASKNKDCGEAAAWLEQAIAAAIDPSAAGRASPELVPLPPPPPVMPLPPPPAASGVTLSGPSAFELGLSPHLSLGSAPSTAFGLQLGAAARWTSLSLGLEGLYDLPASTVVIGGQVKTSLLAATLAPCYLAGSFGGVGLGACGLVTGGAFSATGVGIPGARDATQGYFSLGGRGQADYEVLSWLKVRGQADLRVPLLRTTLTSGNSKLWSTPPVAFTLGVAAVAQLPQ